MEGTTQALTAYRLFRKVSEKLALGSLLFALRSLLFALQCGEKIVKADVGRQLTTLIANLRRAPKRKTIAVPVIRYVKAVA